MLAVDGQNVSCETRGEVDILCSWVCQHNYSMEQNIIHKVALQWIWIEAAPLKFEHPDIILQRLRLAAVPRPDLIAPHI